jgi:hypothetical protein
MINTVNNDSTPRPQNAEARDTCTARPPATPKIQRYTLLPEYPLDFALAAIELLGGVISLHVRISWSVSQLILFLLGLGGLYKIEGSPVLDPFSFSASPHAHRWMLLPRPHKSTWYIAKMHEYSIFWKMGAAVAAWYLTYMLWSLRRNIIAAQNSGLKYTVTP